MSARRPDEKLSDFLARVLITPSMRPGNKSICDLADFTERECDAYLTSMQRHSQTGSAAFPVAHPTGPADYKTWNVARIAGTMWRGEYGRNRRKLLRDMVRWLRERGY